MGFQRVLQVKFSPESVDMTQSWKSKFYLTRICDKSLLKQVLVSDDLYSVIFYWNFLLFWRQTFKVRWIHSNFLNLHKWLNSSGCLAATDINFLWILSVPDSNVFDAFCRTSYQTRNDPNIQYILSLQH
jgi:hypothetical protein